MFTQDELDSLNEKFQFYRYTDQTEENNVLAGQFFAIDQHAAPEPSTNDTYNFDAVVKILNQPNSAVRLGKLNSLFIDKCVQVPGSNPAKTVAQTHPNLIRYLLAL